MTVLLRRPEVPDGAAMWRLARDSGALDTNSPYSYALWCRDFAGTSIVGAVDGRVVAFVTGYVRPEAPDTLFVWQVAVERAHRCRGLGRRMLLTLFAEVAGRLGVTHLEATVTPDNAPSRRMFEVFAAANSAGLHRHVLFRGDELMADGTEPAQPPEDEVLLRIGPVPPGYSPISSGEDPNGSAASCTIARNT